MKITFVQETKTIEKTLKILNSTLHKVKVYLINDEFPCVDNHLRMIQEEFLKIINRYIKENFRSCKSILQNKKSQNLLNDVCFKK